MTFNPLIDPTTLGHVQSLRDHAKAFLEAGLCASAKLHATILLESLSQAGAPLYDPAIRSVALHARATLARACAQDGELQRALIHFEMAIAVIRTLSLGFSTASLSAEDVLIVQDGALAHEQAGHGLEGVHWILNVVPEQLRTGKMLSFVMRHGSHAQKRQACHALLIRHPTSPELLNQFFAFGGKPEDLDILLMDHPPPTPVLPFTRTLWRATYAAFQSQFSAIQPTLLPPAAPSASPSTFSFLTCPSPDLLVHLGICAIRTLDVRTAIAHFERALKVDGFLVRGMDWYALALYEAGKKTDVRHLAQDVAQRAPVGAPEVANVRLIASFATLAFDEKLVAEVTSNAVAAASISGHASSGSNAGASACWVPPLAPYLHGHMHLVRGQYAKARDAFRPLTKSRVLRDLLVFRGCVTATIEWIEDDRERAHQMHLGQGWAPPRGCMGADEVERLKREALHVLGELQGAYGSLVDANVLVARALVVVGNEAQWQEVARHMGELCAAQPGNKLAVVAAVKALIACKRSSEAKQVLDKHRAYLPASVYWHQLAKVHISTDSVTDAAAALAEAYAADQENTRLRRELHNLIQVQKRMHTRPEDATAMSTTGAPISSQAEGLEESQPNDLMPLTALDPMDNGEEEEEDYESDSDGL
ncbi:hypothetical protein BCR44DRAFT_42777 [Catenaria anguillulae PL171]|uniref:Uncharacterized protein n=1 Tax=Catenaria anguillulae PL171 TaxID=765915 RepID=A0A1Y2HY24_9FUNG|nr:hypothetical protein BCR44DRAFT_42777 [Catenaria anguillulae PL171]